jgi:hypothetical protein
MVNVIMKDLTLICLIDGGTAAHNHAQTQSERKTDLIEKTI